MGNGNAKCVCVCVCIKIKHSHKYNTWVWNAIYSISIEYALNVIQFVMSGGKKVATEEMDAGWLHRNLFRANIQMWMSKSAILESHKH